MMRSLMPESSPDSVNSPNVLSIKESIIALTAIMGLFLFLLGPSLLAKFYIVEDHHLVQGASWGLSDWLGRIALDVQNFQRFRPAYWVYIALGCKLFGTNPHLWHAAVMLWGVLTCYLLYSAMRRIGADTRSTLVFVVLLVASGNQNWIWLNLIPQETMGTLLVAIAVSAIVSASQVRNPRKWDVLSLVAITLAGLVKESFVLLLPALIVLRWTLQKYFSDDSWEKSLSQLRPVLIAWGIVFVVEISIVMAVFLSKSNGYSAKVSGLSATSFNPLQWVAVISKLGLGMQLMLVVPILVWSGLIYKKNDRALLLATASIFALWLFPQIILYTNGINERYLFPSIIILAAAVALGLSVLWIRQMRFLWVLGILSLLPALIGGVSSTNRIAGMITAETVASNRMVEFLAQNIPNNKVILLAGDPGTAYGFEANRSLPLYLKLAGAHSQTYMWPLVAKGARSNMHIASSANNPAFRSPATLIPGDVGAIIIVDTYTPGLSMGPLREWLGNTEWRELNFKEPYYSFAISKFKFLKIGESNHRILLSPTAGGVPGTEPLIKIDSSLIGLVSVSPFLDTPPWGLERDYAGPGSIVWLGQGAAEGLGWILRSTGEQPVNIIVELVPGPSRVDHLRTVELNIENSSGRQTQRHAYEGGKWECTVRVSPGLNNFRLDILDKATISIQPNGDTRKLLALLRSLTITTHDKTVNP